MLPRKAIWYYRTGGADDDWNRLLYLQLSNIPLATTNRWLAEVVNSSSSSTLSVSSSSPSSLSALQAMYRPIELPACRIGSKEEGDYDNISSSTRAFFDGRPRLRSCTLRNMGLRFCVLLVFFVVGLLFTGTQNVVIAPIERMVCQYACVMLF